MKDSEIVAPGKQMKIVSCIFNKFISKLMYFDNNTDGYVLYHILIYRIK
jgi:hypothetical protein